LLKKNRYKKDKENIYGENKDKDKDKFIFKIIFIISKIRITRKYICPVCISYIHFSNFKRETKYYYTFLFSNSIENRNKNGGNEKRKGAGGEGYVVMKM
jgi:hypothetical protein